MMDKVWKKLKENGLRYGGILLIFLLLGTVYFIRQGRNETEVQLWRKAGDSEETVTEVRSDSFSEDVLSEAGEKEERTMIYCQIEGAVNHPGVYLLEEGSRVFQLIECAGGLKEEAYTKDLNQAELLLDGEKITVPTEKEAGTSPVVTYSVRLSEASSGGSSAVTSGQEDGNGNGKGIEKASEKGLVNINTASSEELQTLKGVGPSIAGKIIDYRNKAGSFSSIEEIMNVSGIGEKTFEKIKDSISVN